MNWKNMQNLQQYLEKNEKAVELIENLMLHGYEIETLKKNEFFRDLIKTSKWEVIENKYPKLREIYFKSINLELRKQISEMSISDQYHRAMLNEKNINKDSIWKIIDKTDSINDKKFKLILEKYSYPSDKIIGGYNIDKKQVDAGTLLFHFSDYEYYTKKLYELIDKGNAPPASLGNFVDSYQRRIKDRKKFIYGIYDNATEDQIIEYEKLDERRISIGLPPLQLEKRIKMLKKKYYGIN